MPFLMFCHLRKRASWHVSLECDSFTVGSSRRATVSVADPRIAAVEIAIRRHGEDFRIASLAGRDRVLLNGEPLAERAISTGDRVRLGDTFLLFVAETHPSDARIDQLEPLLDREIFAPEHVREALEEGASAGRLNWPVLVALGMCGLAIGVVLAIVLARLRD